ncbi:bacteriocin-like protein [Chryseobacterium sp. RRHN12]|uniref:bacteriocin-like protein n=1 Tax=Chryseobacterium sp. RRHN12 TaxID=3437884 RepID=UPI003D9B232D
MKNLKKLDRKSLKNVKGSVGICSLNCEIHETCGTGCYGEPMCVPKGEHFPPNC